MFLNSSLLLNVIVANHIINVINLLWFVLQVLLQGVAQYSMNDALPN